MLTGLTYKWPAHIRFAVFCKVEDSVIGGFHVSSALLRIVAVASEYTLANAVSNFSNGEVATCIGVNNALGTSNDDFRFNSN